MKTKKLLAPFDFGSPNKKISGFLYPNTDVDQTHSFLEIRTGKEWKSGMVVLVGKELSKEDVFAKIVDSGKKIVSVNQLLTSIEDYLRQIGGYKIGDVLGIKPSNGGFELVKLERPRRSVASKLPR